MSTRMRAAAVSGTATLVLGLLTGVPAAWAAPPDTCDGLTATIVGTDGDDRLTGTDGDDVVSLGAGNDAFQGGYGNDIVCGGPGSDGLTGDDGDDRLFGGDDGDSLQGGLGDDLLDGGAANDTIWDQRLPEVPVAGGDGADHVIGGPGDDDVHLLDADPLGGGGADVAHGGEGVDMVSYESSPTGVTIDAAAGTARGAATDTLTGFEVYRGTYYADTLLGSDRPEVLEGSLSYDGRDYLSGRAGDDTLSAEQRALINAGSGNDTYEATGITLEEVDVNLGSGDDRALVWGLANTIRGQRGRDTFVVHGPYETPVRQRLYGGRGLDRLNFAAFPDPVRADAHLGRATGHRLQLRFWNIERVLGTDYDDILLGSARRNTLHGRGGDDLLRGRRARDVLIGGRGHDIARGGPARDTCSAERLSSCELRP